MLPKNQRLKGKKLFNEIYKKGRVYSNNLLVIYLFNRGNRYPDLHESRAGFVVSKKISKKAVIRNKIRRRTSECYRILTSGICNNTDIIWCVRKAIINATMSDIKSAVFDLLTKAGQL